MKKLIAFLLCLVMVASLFAGCGGSGTELGGSGTEPSGNSAIQSLDDLPDDITLTIGLPLDARVEDYDTNAFTLWLEEQTGYNLEFVEFQSNPADYKAQLSGMMSVGDELPDILWGFGLDKVAYEEYGHDGYFIDLAPYYNDKEASKVFWERMDELKALDEDYYDYLLKMLTTEDGEMFALSRIEYTLVDTMVYQPYINQEWLDTLDLPMPTNPTELYNTLVAFRDRDPNGNGKKDEMPLIGSASATGGSAVWWLVNMFTYTHYQRMFNVDENNQLYLPFLTDAYRDALIYMRKLKDEGLMFDTAFSMTQNDVKGLVNVPEGEDQKVGIAVGHPTLIFEPGNPCVYQYAALPCWSNAVRRDQSFEACVFITEDCEYPRAAWELLMTMHTKEGSYRLRYGQYGVDYVDADPGTTSFLGLPAEIKVVNEDALSGKNNSCWHNVFGTVMIYAENEVCQLSPDMGEWVNHKMKIMGDSVNKFVEAEEKFTDSECIMPVVMVPSEVAEAHKVEKSNVEALLREARAGFATGKHAKYNNPSDDAQWAAYLAEVESLGYKTWQSNMQALYENQFPERMP